MNFINASSHGKAPKIEFPPKKWLGYPKLMIESKEADWQLEFATCVWQVIAPLMKRHIDWCVYPQLLIHEPIIASLWRQYQNVDAIIAQYNTKSITFTKQY
ncbi:hypothetical protein AVEN_84827-1 [Araneus ventricosus]|uniref:Uncharacterized protein n=1 Tax=Araneus ventricosus TaxID=182803 RepID=A0A4Y2IXS2_ARAVE|nr:hypothetical protein AVEN_84827-1 [Araneus ventricosus]